MTSDEELPDPANDQAQDPSPTAPNDPLAEAQGEIARLKDQLLRAMAETENTRRRLQKEIEDAQKYALTAFAKDMLAIADNFTRAMASVPKTQIKDDTCKNLLTGIEAIERQMAATFEVFGIKKMDSLGQPFDPHKHRVMMEQEDPGKPAGTIIQVFQPGYMIHDRLLREAMVVISKGGAPSHTVDQSA